MTTESLPNAGQVEAPRLADADHTPAGGSCCGLRNEASHFLSCANNHIRKNPVPMVAGAAVLGLALGLLMSGRHEEPVCKASFLNDLPDQANDFLSNTLATLRGNLKFW
ncbi:MAG: hypothetical protein EOP88_15630 [Verrucomicrobiaceae bacterium]|nr:MAG: hypothetical protein EOP88_15630 [Verrucomicrobiaceae bacterium]